MTHITDGINIHIPTQVGYFVVGSYRDLNEPLDDLPYKIVFQLKDEVSPLAELSFSRNNSFASLPFVAPRGESRVIVF
jgi:hypothetical protein